jgi:hypothetical protein
MPNITLKRFTGSVWEEMLPTPASHAHGVTTIGDILVSYDGTTLSRLGTSGSNNRFLKVSLQGSDLVPGYSSILDTDIPNISTAKLTSGTLGLLRGGTGNTTVTAGGVVFGQTGGTSYTNTAAPTATTQYLGATFNGVNNQPAWTSPTDSTGNAAISTSLTGLITTRAVAFGLTRINNEDQTRGTTIYAPTSAGTAYQILVSNGGTSAPSWSGTTSNVNSAAIGSTTDYTTIITGSSRAIVSLYRDATTKVAEYSVDLKNTNEYSTTTRNFRYVWSDGSSTFANLLQVQATGTGGNTLRVRHGSGGTMIFRITKVI